MDTRTTIIMLSSIFIIILSIIWLLRIRKSRKQDPDYRRQDAAMKKDESNNPNA
jgi:preprotein translocase subunit YajC